MNNRGKSSDIYGVTAECIAYGGKKPRNVLLNLINTSFEHCLLQDLLKIGTLTRIFKNKGLIIDAKNYRGITITPTLSKIVETIIEFLINPTILSVQNPLQRGFTEHSTPLISSLMLEEVGWENKDNRKPTIIGMLDAKSAFDVVRHANLIRKLYHYGISKQCILMIDSLYRNATTKIKWKGEFSEGFKFEQGVRQGGTLSADLCKIYVNHLLDILNCAGVGANIGSIKCCAPTCADDIVLTGSNPQDIQAMINIAYNNEKDIHYNRPKV